MIFTRCEIPQQKVRHYSPSKTQISSILPTEHGRFVPGWRHDPGFLHRFLPEQQEAGSPEKSEDREAAGDGAAGSAAAAGVRPYLTIPGCVGGSQTLTLLLPQRGH